MKNKKKCVESGILQRYVNMKRLGIHTYALKCAQCNGIYGYYIWNRRQVWRVMQIAKIHFANCCYPEIPNRILGLGLKANIRDLTLRIFDAHTNYIYILKIRKL